jgi:C-terminal processing protease CtpA/Prc
MTALVEPSTLRQRQRPAWRSIIIDVRGNAGGDDTKAMKLRKVFDLQPIFLQIISSSNPG